MSEVCFWDYFVRDTEVARKIYAELVEGGVEHFIGPGNGPSQWMRSVAEEYEGIFEDILGMMVRHFLRYEGAFGAIAVDQYPYTLVLRRQMLKVPIPEELKKRMDHVISLSGQNSQNTAFREMWDDLAGKLAHFNYRLPYEVYWAKMYSGFGTTVLVVDRSRW